MSTPKPQPVGNQEEISISPKAATVKPEPAPENPEKRENEQAKKQVERNTLDALGALAAKITGEQSFAELPGKLRGAQASLTEIQTGVEQENALPEKLSGPFKKLLEFILGFFATLGFKGVDEDKEDTHHEDKPNTKHEHGSKARTIKLLPKSKKYTGVNVPPPKTVKSVQTEHAKPRKKPISGAVIHTMESGNWGYFESNDRKVSTHFAIRRDGTCAQMCDLDYIAYHAAKNNGQTIGIDLENADPSSEGFTHEQYVTLSKILAYAIAKYGMPIDGGLRDFGNIFGHEDSTSNRGDPGPHFEWNLIKKMTIAEIEKYREEEEQNIA